MKSFRQPNQTDVKCRGKSFPPFSLGERNVQEANESLSVAWTNYMVHDCMCAALEEERESVSMGD